MVWTKAYPATRRAAFLFGTFLLSHVLLAEGAAPAWLELLSQAQQAHQSEEYSAAATLAQRALTLAEKVPSSGSADLNLAAVLNTLGAARLALGQPGEAAPLLVRALDIRRRLLPRPHLDLAVSLSNHASALLLTGEFTPAHVAASDAVAMFESIHATNTVDYGLALNNLAAASVGQGEYASAIPIFDRARGVLATILPPVAPRIVRVLINEGAAVQRSGDLARASQLLEDAVALARQQSRAEPVLLSGAINALGDLRMQQGRATDAEQLFVEALKVAASINPPMPLRSGVIEANLARAYQRRGHPEQAEERFKSALDTLRAVQSIAPTEYAAELNNYGLLMLSQRRFAPAGEAFAEAQRIFESKLGAAHPSSIAVIVNLADVAERRHQWARAAELYQRAVDLDTQHFGRNHFRVALDLNSLGAFEARRKHFPEAMKLLRESLDILRASYGPEHPDVALVAANLGRTLWMTKRYDEAEGLFAEAIRVQESHFGLDYAQLVPLYEEYAQLLHTNQHFAASESVKLRAMRIRVRQALGKTTA